MSGKVVPGMPDKPDQAPLPPAPTETQADNAEAPQVIYVGQRRAFVRRIGCGFAVILWAVFMLIPGFLLLLAVQNEVIIWHGSSVPEPEAHPLLQVKLLMEIQTRGVSITTSQPQTSANNQTCMQTHVRYVLWQGQGENVSYCDCYTRLEGGAWQFMSTASGNCGS
jgi:hypothetical protein